MSPKRQKVVAKRATKNNNEKNDGVGTFPTPILETSAIGHESPREPGETEDGGAGNQDNNQENDGVGTFPTPILKTLAVGHEIPREPGETEGGSDKASDRDDDKENEESSVGKHVPPDGTGWKMQRTG